MDLKNQIAVVKPVAWKPSPARFQSFSALLNAAVVDIDDDRQPRPAVADSDQNQLVVTAAIRPKTVRLKPANSIVRNYQDPTFMNPFKAQPKMGTDDLIKQDSTKSEPVGTLTFGQSGNSMHEPNRVNNVIKRTSEALKMIEQNKCFPPWYDGYTWRKYGQKQVKGSEYPRSYYRCTHPNCPVKKMIERSLSGQIEGVVYKGEHNHPKPPPAKRNHLGLGGFDQFEVENSGFESKIDYQGHHKVVIEPKLTKRRKSESSQLSDHDSISGEVVGNDKVTIPNIMSVESETTGDPFRWRKYGQKAVKGNPNPRSYYRCTNLKCTARKYVERSSDDSNALITTYEGKHNHDVPISSNAKF